MGIARVEKTRMLIKNNNHSGRYAAIKSGTASIVTKEKLARMGG
jgi:hypothetical protein